eukprot:gene4840-34596_t
MLCSNLGGLTPPRASLSNRTPSLSLSSCPPLYFSHPRPSPCSPAHLVSGTHAILRAPPIGSISIKTENGVVVSTSTSSTPSDDPNQITESNQNPTDSMETPPPLDTHPHPQQLPGPQPPETVSAAAAAAAEASNQLPDTYLTALGEEEAGMPSPSPKDTAKFQHSQPTSTYNYHTITPIPSSSPTPVTPSSARSTTDESTPAPDHATYNRRWQSDGAWVERGVSSSGQESEVSALSSGSSMRRGGSMDDIKTLSLNQIQDLKDDDDGYLNPLADWALVYAIAIGGIVGTIVFAFDVSIQYVHDLPDILATLGIGGGRTMGFPFLFGSFVPFRCIMPIGAGVIVAGLIAKGFSPPLKSLTRAIDDVQDSDNMDYAGFPKGPGQSLTRAVDDVQDSDNMDYAGFPKDPGQVFRKAAASAITLGSGASLGPEAPSVELGANTAALLLPKKMSR